MEAGCTRLLQNVLLTMKVKAELHCHSEYSRDCSVSLEAIIDRCKEENIRVIALTDHDEIAGAERLKAIAPKWLHVIVGEEIATAQGDVIGLFLKERIAPRQGIKQTIHQIKEQGGVVLLPHPFDRIRREAVGEVTASRIVRDIDFLEIFNSRCVFGGDNARATIFAAESNLPVFVGSDAHTLPEYGRATNLIEEFSGTKEFVVNLKNATFVTRKSPLRVHLTTKFVKIKKKRTKKHAR